MLPSWVGDLANVLGIAGALIAVFAWLLKQLVPRDPPRRGARPRPRTGTPQPVPVRQEHRTLGNYIREAIIHAIIRPDVPIGQDVGRIAGGIFGLIATAVLWVMNATDPQTASMPILPFLQAVGFYAMLGLALMLVLFVARLLWKIDYMHGRDDDS